MSPQPSRELSQVLLKLPFFKGLSPDEMGKVLSLCTPGFYQTGDNIWGGGDTPSNEMYILLAGELAVKTAEGVQVATIKPIATVGEIGIITSQPRSAIVEAIQPSNIFVIPKPTFDHMLQNNLEIQVKIYRNVIQILATKLINDSVRKRDLANQARQEKTVPEKRPAPVPAPAQPASTDQVESPGSTPSLDQLAPKDQVPQDTAAPPTAAAAKGGSQRILIVDDEPEIRNLVKTALSSFETVEASNGKEGLQVLQAEQPDLVIADIKMPEMDGFTFLTHLRAQYPDLPVLALSGYVESDEILRYTFDGFIAKPLKIDEVRKIVEEALVGEDPEM